MSDHGLIERLSVIFATKTKKIPSGSYDDKVTTNHLFFYISFKKKWVKNIDSFFSNSFTY